MAERVALVVAGAGARGAYEAGALSTLLPALEAKRQAPSLLFGTSAGALNVVALAAHADAGMAAASGNAVALWEQVRMGQVTSVVRSGLEDLGRYLLQLVGAGRLFGHRAEVLSLLDTSHLVDTIAPLIDWDRLHDNVRSGVVQAVAVATTSDATGGTVVFVEKHRSVALPPADSRRNIVYVQTELTAEHAVASAAIPVAFRAQHVSTPRALRGWYVDGGTRLNVPIKPALAFGADRLAVVSSQAATYGAVDAPARRGARRGGDGVAPDVFGAAAQALHGLLADRMVEDLRTLATINAVLPQAHYRGRRRIPFVFAGPASLQQEASIGRTAQEQFARRIEDGGLVRHTDLWLLSHLIGGSERSHGDLLSYLFFDPAFTTAAARLGAQQARGAVQPLRWRTSLARGG